VKGFLVWMRPERSCSLSPLRKASLFFSSSSLRALRSLFSFAKTLMAGAPAPWSSFSAR
jgi:hypothetical protein